MDQDWLRAVRERQDEVREEITRHRLGVALHVRRPAGRLVSRWRRAVGRLVVGLGRVIEGDERAAERASLPCN